MADCCDASRASPTKANAGVSENSSPSCTLQCPPPSQAGKPVLVRKHMLYGLTA